MRQRVLDMRKHWLVCASRALKVAHCVSSAGSSIVNASTPNIWVPMNSLREVVGHAHAPAAGAPPELEEAEPGSQGAAVAHTERLLAVDRVTLEYRTRDRLWPAASRSRLVVVRRG